MEHIKKLHLDAIKQFEHHCTPLKDFASKSAEITEQIAIQFWAWMRENDTPDNAERYGNFTDKDMYQEFLKTKQ